MQRLSVLLVGCGGLGGEISHGLIRNGVRSLTLCDQDNVELSNLNRQRFYAADLYKKKALQLAHNLIQEAVQPLTIIGIAQTAQEAIEQGRVGRVDAVICGVDNDDARIYIARWALAQHIPVIFTAVNLMADYGYVFVQKSQPGEPCFGCLFPDAVRQAGPAPCAAGATIDILKTVSGPVLYALGALFMPARVCRWRYKEIYLSGAGQDGNRDIVRRSDCPICRGG